jgi:hypothetical protein
MTKADLQKELLAKVKLGTKPSHLKRSKSLSDIPIAPPLPTSPIPLVRSQSAQELEPTVSKLDQLKDEISILALKLETSEREKAELTVDNQQLKVALQEIDYQTKTRQLDSLALVPTNPLPPSELTELDQALISRHQTLKDFFKQYQKAQSLEQELEENIDYASEEIIRQDDEILKLKRENVKLKSSN